MKSTLAMNQGLHIMWKFMHRVRMNREHVASKDIFGYYGYCGYCGYYVYCGYYGY